MSAQGASVPEMAECSRTTQEINIDLVEQAKRLSEKADKAEKLIKKTSKEKLASIFGFAFPKKSNV